MASANYRFGIKNGAAGNQDDDHMDSLNRSMAETLSKKVGQLKSLAIDLDGETRDHVPLLENLGDDMDTVGVRMGGTSGRIRNASRNRGFMMGRKFTCGVGLAVTVFLFFVYYLMSRSSG